MYCPNCHQEMKEVSVPSHYGAPIGLDQCPGCGGVWFDGLELFQAKHGEAGRIDAVDGDKLARPAVCAAELLCPRDKTVLTVFSDPNFPSDIQIESCPVCGGLWLNRGEFREFQKIRIEKIRTFEEEHWDRDMRTRQRIEAMFAANRDTTYGALGRLGAFLSAPVPVSAQRDSGFTDDTTRSGGIAARIGMEVVTALLKALLRGLR